MGFAELVIIAIVGLIVIGPEKLPQAIKTGLVWFGRIKRLVSETRSEFEQQLGVDDIRREIHNEEVLDSLKSLKIAKQDVEDSTRKLGDAIQDGLDEDDGLFGDQRTNHPPQEEEPMIKRAEVPHTQDEGGTEAKP